MTTVRFMDDFCLPHGRFLERTSIDEGSVLLRALDGGLRVVDQGKKIAIPGAADLVGMTVGLPGSIRVAGAMTAGTIRLFATFPPEVQQRFGPIPTRACASPSPGRGRGARFWSPTSSRWSTRPRSTWPPRPPPASRGAETILNDPPRITLSDYARATVSGVTVDLGDRTIDDGAMTVGDTALQSTTARFSAVDLLKSVTIRAPGRHVTTIESVQDGTHVTLATPAQRTVDGGQADVWLVSPESGADSRPALEELLATLASADVESAEIRFGSGAYDLTPHGDRPEREAWRDLAQRAEEPDPAEIGARGDYPSPAAGPGPAGRRARGAHEELCPRHGA